MNAGTGLTGARSGSSGILAHGPAEGVQPQEIPFLLFIARGDEVAAAAKLMLA